MWVLLSNLYNPIAFSSLICDVLTFMGRKTIVNQGIWAFSNCLMYNCTSHNKIVLKRCLFPNLHLKQLHHKTESLCIKF